MVKQGNINMVKQGNINMVKPGNINEILCKPPSVGFKVFNRDGSECFTTDVSNLTLQDMRKQSYREAIKHQSKVMENLKRKDINGKLMRFKKAWRCSIGRHSWYCFYGQYSVCDNYGLMKQK